MTERSLETRIDEVVLGLASDEEVIRLETLAAANPALAAQLEQARQRFAPLDDTAEALPLPADFWDRIAAQLEGTAPDTAGQDTAGPDAAAPGEAPEATPQAAPENPPAAENVVTLDSRRSPVGRWRSTALGAIAATLLMAFALGWSLLATPEPLVVAVLLDDRGEAVALVESGAENTTRVTMLERPDVPSDRVMQVWTKPEDDGPPVSLGLLSNGSSMTLAVDGLPVPHARQLYEITVEPAGGSPTNLPTGPILGKGLAKEPLT